MEAIQKITEATPDTEVRICRRLEIGKVIHQGDVYLHRVDPKHPRGKRLGTRQVAVGEQVGARHIVEGSGVSVFAGEQLPEWVSEPDWCEEGSMLGPVVVARRTFELTHPEHANHRLPAGTYQVTYQLDALTNQRVID